MKYKKLIALGITISILCFTYQYFVLKAVPKEESLEILYINNSNPEELRQVKASIVAITSMVKTKLDLPINFTILEVKSDDEYRIKRNTIMLSSHPPDLILAGRQPLDDLKNLGVLMPLEGKIENMDNVYKALRGTHTVAYGFHIKSAVINKKLISALDLKIPSPDWMDSDVVSLIDQMKMKRPNMKLYLTKDLYDSYFNTYLADGLTQKLTGNIDDFTLTDPAFLEALMSMKTTLNRHFDLHEFPNQQARVKMIFEPKSQEYLRQERDIEEHILDNFTVVQGINSMNAVMLTKLYAKTQDLVLLPIGNRMETLRFAISDKAPHKEQATLFLNLALNWDTQFKFALFSDRVKFAQVNAENEGRLLAYGEAFASDSNVVDIRQKVISLLDKDFYRDLGEMDSRELIVREELMRTTFNIVFDPKLSNQANLLKELKIVEDRIKLMIKE